MRKWEMFSDKELELIHDELMPDLLGLRSMLRVEIRDEENFRLALKEKEAVKLDFNLSDAEQMMKEFMENPSGSFKPAIDITEEEFIKRYTK